jgi:glycerophosphoryl diester phosphodiesterase
MITPLRTAMSALAGAVLLSILGAAPALAATTKTNPFRQARPWNIAHQGGEDEFPSNTLYAFKRAVKAGADMLELDVGVTKEGVVVVRHDTTVDSTTNGRGEVASFTLKQIRRLDGAYWFSPRSPHYDRGRPASAYPFRGIATGRRKPPKGYSRSDFRVATLAEVMAAFPRTPINVEIKGRTKTEAISEYLTNARHLARLLKGTPRRDIIVVSFKQEAVDLFHQLAPKLPLAPGVTGSQNFLLGNVLPGPGVVAFQLPTTYVINGAKIVVSSREFIAKAHNAGFAWHTWFNNGDPDAAVTWQALIDNCVDGVMTSRSVAFERFLKTHPSPAACRV